VEKITTNFEVDEIILFGSYARGTANDNSDIDVAVISPDLNMNYPMFDNALTIIRKTKA
jgi:predicted nucleotidyltransferase